MTSIYMIKFDQTPDQETWPLSPLYYNGNFVQQTGSANCLCSLQECIQKVLVVMNLNPLFETHSCTLFTHSCKSLSACGRDFACIHKAKSSTNNEASGPFKTDFTTLLILRLKRTGDKMLPWRTPISCSCVSDKVEPALTWNS